MKITVFHREDLFSPHISRPLNEDIHIWILPSDSTKDLEKDIEKLSPAELERSGKFVQKTDRLHYLIGHACLRRILGAYLDLPAESLVFEKGEHGKPFLSSGTPGLPIHFNLSHSRKQIALIFGNSPVGIDIQALKSSENIPALVKRYFHPDEFSLFSGLEKEKQEELFYRYWSIREAFLKGLGTGLTLSPSSFFVCPESESSFRITKGTKNYSDWTIHSVPAPNGYVCSLAFQESHSTVK